MDRRDISNSFCGVLLAGGIAAVIASTALEAASPYFKVLIIGGAISIVLAILGLAYLWFTSPQSRVSKISSTFLKTDGGGEIDIEDSFSSADTFFDVKGSPRISARRNRHEPGRGGKT
jgi:hypothetical protein